MSNGVIDLTLSDSHEEEEEEGEIRGTTAVQERPIAEPVKTETLSSPDNQGLDPTQSAPTDASVAPPAEKQHSLSYVVDTEATAASTQAAKTALIPEPPDAEPTTGKRRRTLSFKRALAMNDNALSSQSETKLTAPQPAQPLPDDRTFHGDALLTPLEMEVLWLGVESMYCHADPDCATFQWDFVWQHASPALLVELRKFPSDQERLPALVRLDNVLVRQRFEFLRHTIMSCLIRGFRRKAMALTIAQHGLRNRMRQRIVDP